MQNILQAWTMGTSILKVNVSPWRTAFFQRFQAGVLPGQKEKGKPPSMVQRQSPNQRDSQTRCPEPQKLLTVSRAVILCLLALAEDRQGDVRKTDGFGSSWFLSKWGSPWVYCSQKTEQIYVPSQWPSLWSRVDAVHSCSMKHYLQ